jgi:glutaredoxin-like protein NrdH
MTHKPVTVYTQPNCQPCRATRRWLDKRGIEYDTIDVTQNLDAYEAVKAMGHQQSPVVYTQTSTGDVSWSGFKPTLLEHHFGVEAAA